MAHRCRPPRWVTFTVQSTMDVVITCTTDTGAEPLTNGLRERGVMVEMYRRMPLLLSAALLTLSVSRTEAQGQTSVLQNGPFFVWSDQPYIAVDSQGSTSRAWYEVSSSRWQP